MKRIFTQKSPFVSVGVKLNSRGKINEPKEVYIMHIYTGTHKMAAGAAWHRRRRARPLTAITRAVISEMRAYLLAACVNMKMSCSSDRNSCIFKPTPPADAARRLCRRFLEVSDRKL